MFHSPHDYQAILEVELPAAATALYRADLAAHGDAIYTINPTTAWVLPDTIQADARFPLDLYRGHFERGGERIASAVECHVRRIVHFRRFDPKATARSSRWIVFGADHERFAAHRLEHAPDVDQVVALAATTPLPSDAPVNDGVDLDHSDALRPGDATPAGSVIRVIYTEYDDLK
jgi:hypothetical protein